MNKLDVPDGVPMSSHGKQLVRISRLDYWQVEGQSRMGKAMKRDGKRVVCGHKHRSKKACLSCLKRLRKERPGKCQMYNIQHFQGFRCLYSKKPIVAD